MSMQKCKGCGEVFEADWRNERLYCDEDAYVIAMLEIGDIEVMYHGTVWWGY